MSFLMFLTDILEGSTIAADSELPMPESSRVKEYQETGTILE